ncbi:amidase [Paenibacillus macerans]|uniref:amidase n=1 Tax=Paenibacillus macerans TaxID=44252 RepID=UPI003D31933D
MSETLTGQSVSELAPLIEQKKLSPIELTKALLDRVEQLNPTVNAYIHIDEESAMQAAKRAEADIAGGGYRGPLHGIPLALKDIFFMEDKVSTMGSKIHKDFVGGYDATVITKLKNAGAVLTGTLNMHEYAWGGTTNNDHFGACRNPWDLERIPGGSSGGSGAAVAADMAFASLGTDTAGSVRIPASICGIVGLKPTHGRVSKHGCFPLSWSLDHIGPMTKTVSDAAILLQAIAGYDAEDPTTLKAPVPQYTEFLTEDIRGLVIGVEEDYFFHNVDPDVAAAIRQGIETLRALGAVIKPVSIPSLKHTLFAEYATVLGESGAIHHHSMKTRPLDFGENVRHSLGYAHLPSAVDFVMAQQIRRKLALEFESAYTQCDVIVAPTLPIAASKIGESFEDLNGAKANIDVELIRFTPPANLTGMPSLSVPCGFKGGLPVGMQIMGKPFDEGTLLKVGYAFEKATNFPAKKPALTVA